MVFSEKTLYTQDAIITIKLNVIDYKFVDNTLKRLQMINTITELITSQQLAQGYTESTSRAQKYSYSNSKM